jgi:hypothetical protein
MTKKKAAEEIVEAEFDAPEEDPGPAPDDPVIFSSGDVAGGSVELTILPPGAPAPEVHPADFEPGEIELAAEPVYIDHLAPIRKEARACYKVYHDTLQGLAVVDFDLRSPAEQSSWMAVAQRSLAAKLRDGTIVEEA